MAPIDLNGNVEKKKSKGGVLGALANNPILRVLDAPRSAVFTVGREFVLDPIFKHQAPSARELFGYGTEANNATEYLLENRSIQQRLATAPLAAKLGVMGLGLGADILTDPLTWGLGGAGLTTKIDEAGNLSRGLLRAAEEGKYMGRVSTARGVVDAADKLGDLEKAGQAGSAILRQGKAGLRTAEELGLMPEGTRFSTALTVKVPFRHTEFGIKGTEAIGNRLLDARASLNEVATDFVRRFETARDGSLQIGRLKPDLRAIATSGAASKVAGEQFVQRFLESSVGSRLQTAGSEVTKEIDSLVAKNFGATQPGDPFYRARRLSLQGDHTGALSAIVDDPRYAEFQSQVLDLMQRPMVTADGRQVAQRVPAGEAVRYLSQANQDFLGRADTLINGTPEAIKKMAKEQGIATVDEAFRRSYRKVIGNAVASFEVGHDYATSLARWPNMAEDLGQKLFGENFDNFVNASNDLQTMAEEGRAVWDRPRGFGLDKTSQTKVVENLVKEHQASIKTLDQSLQADRAAELTKHYAPIADWAGRRDAEITSQAEVLKLFKNGMSGAVADQVQRMEAPLVEKAKRYFQQTGEMPAHMLDEVVQAKRDGAVAAAWQPNDTYVWSGFKPGTRPERVFASADEATKFFSSRGFTALFRKSAEEQVLQAIPDTSVSRGLTKYQTWMEARDAAAAAGKKAPRLKLSGQVLDDLTNVVRKYGPAKAAEFMDPAHWNQVVKAWSEQPARDLYKALWANENPGKLSLEELVARVSQSRSEGRMLPNWVPGHGSLDDAMSAVDAEVQARRAKVTAARVGDLGTSLDTSSAFAGIPALKDVFQPGQALKDAPALIAEALKNEGFVPNVAQAARQAAAQTEKYVLSYPNLENAVAHLGTVQGTAEAALSSLDQSLTALDSLVEKLGVLIPEAKGLTRETLPGAPQDLQSLFQRMGEAAGQQGPQAMLRGFGDFSQWVVGGEQGSGLTRLRTRLQAYRDAVTARVKVYEDFRQAATQQIQARNAETLAKLQELGQGTTEALRQGFQDADQAVVAARDGFYEMAPHAKGATRLYQTPAGDFVQGGKRYGGLVPPEAVQGNKARYVDVAGDVSIHQSAPGRFTLPPEVADGIVTIPVIPNPTKTVAELAQAAAEGARADVLDGDMLRVGRKLDYLLGKSGTDEVAREISAGAQAVMGDAARYVDELFRSDDRVAQMKALQAVVDAAPQLAQQRLDRVQQLYGIAVKGEELKAQIADMLLRGGMAAAETPEERAKIAAGIAGGWWNDTKTALGRPAKLNAEAFDAGFTSLAVRPDADMAYLLASSAIEKAGFRALGNGLFMTPNLKDRLAPVFIDEGELLKSLNKVTKMWRTMALLGPRFNNTNWTGGFKNNLAFGAGFGIHRDEAIIEKAFHEIAKTENMVELNKWLSQETFRAGGKAYRGDAVRFMLQRLVGSGLKASFADDLDSMAHSVLAQKFAGGARKVQDFYERVAPMKRAALAGTGAGEVAVENNLRGALFLKLVHEDKMGLEAAWDQVRMVHFDYQDMSALDKRLRDAWVPFWAFRSRNVPLQAFMATYNPALTTSLWKAGARSFETARNQGYLGDTPWWAQTGMAAALPGASVISGYPDPFNDFAQQINAASNLRAKPGQFFNSVAQSFGGPIQFGMETFANKDLLTGRAISPSDSASPWRDYLANAFGTFSGQAFSPLTAKTTSAGPPRSDPRWWLETFGVIPFNVRNYDV